MNTLDQIIAVTSPKAHMISALTHRLMARIAPLEADIQDHESQVETQKCARQEAKACIITGGEFSWFAEYAEQWDKAWDSMTEAQEPSVEEVASTRLLDARTQVSRVYWLSLTMIF